MTAFLKNCFTIFTGYGMKNAILLMHYCKPAFSSTLSMQGDAIGSFPRFWQLLNIKEPLRSAFTGTRTRTALGCILEMTLPGVQHFRDMTFASDANDCVPSQTRRGLDDLLLIRKWHKHSQALSLKQTDTATNTISTGSGLKQRKKMKIL